MYTEHKMHIFKGWDSLGGSFQVAHKANVLRLSDTLFLKCCREVSAAYPQIQYTEQLCDSLLTAMVMHPGAIGLRGGLSTASFANGFARIVPIYSISFHFKHPFACFP